MNGIVGSLGPHFPRAEDLDPDRDRDSEETLSDSSIKESSSHSGVTTVEEEAKTAV